MLAADWLPSVLTFLGSTAIAVLVALIAAVIGLRGSRIQAATVGRATALDEIKFQVDLLTARNRELTAENELLRIGLRREQVRGDELERRLGEEQVRGNERERRLNVATGDIAELTKTVDDLRNGLDAT